MLRVVLLVASLGAVLCFHGPDASEKNRPGSSDFALLIVATNETEGYKRLMKSANHYSIPVKVLGLHEAWVGGNMEGEGGGQKVNLLRKALKPLLANPHQIIMFTDGYDVIMTSDASTIIAKFLSFDARILFSAEVYCWPDVGLTKKYPATQARYKFLNSGGFMGYASDIYELISSHSINDKADDQLYYTKLFLDKSLRDKYSMKLDYNATVFQNLNGADGDIDVQVIGSGGGKSYVINKVTNSVPSVLHGNGPSKLLLNSLGNYVAGAWSYEKQEVTTSENYPVVLIGLFVTQPSPFIEDFFQKVDRLNYPKNKIRLYVYNNVEYHRKHVKDFLRDNKAQYMGVKQIKPEDKTLEENARTLALEYCLKVKCDYYFSLDTLAHIDMANTLSILMSSDKAVVAPLLSRPYKAWSNFWGALNGDGFYSRSFDYMDIVNNDRRGVWNVPYITHGYLINATVIPTIMKAYTEPGMDPDMAFCRYLRSKEVWMFVDNRANFGYLIDPENFSTALVNPDFYQLIDNQWAWEQRYIHANYSKALQKDNVPAQPCPDVYWFPIVTPRFCRELIEIMENFGQWSTGSNYFANRKKENSKLDEVNKTDDGIKSIDYTELPQADERLNGGYENVPTRDIHMNQVGLEPLWLKFLDRYVRPLQEHVFVGYFHDPPKSLMNFVVRYRPDEQPSLRPHHDSSTYTINLALNTADVDYQGGGCRFLRYNCSVLATRQGWMLMHPGRLTHYHEGLLVTNGTRYIMISFVDP